MLVRHSAGLAVDACRPHQCALGPPDAVQRQSRAAWPRRLLMASRASKSEHRRRSPRLPVHERPCSSRATVSATEAWQALTMADATPDGTSRHAHHRAGVLDAVLASGGVTREQIGASPPLPPLPDHERPCSSRDTVGATEAWQALTMAGATPDGTSRHAHHRAGVLEAVLASGGVTREQIRAQRAVPRPARHAPGAKPPAPPPAHEPTPRLQGQTAV